MKTRTFYCSQNAKITKFQNVLFCRLKAKFQKRMKKNPKQMILVNPRNSRIFKDSRFQGSQEIKETKKKPEQLSGFKKWKEINHFEDI